MVNLHTIELRTNFSTLLNFANFVSIEGNILGMCYLARAKSSCWSLLRLYLSWLWIQLVYCSIHKGNDCFARHSILNVCGGTSRPLKGLPCSAVRCSGTATAGSRRNLQVGTPSLPCFKQDQVGLQDHPRRRRKFLRLFVGMSDMDVCWVVKTATRIRVNLKVSAGRAGYD